MSLARVEPASFFLAKPMSNVCFVGSTDFFYLTSVVLFVVVISSS